MALSPLTQDLLMGPPRSRQGSTAQPKKNPIDTFLTTPGGSFLMNILAQQGFSPVPHSQIGAIGKAALATQQQGRERTQDDLQKRLIESQIGLNQFRGTAQGLNPTAGNVQSTFPGADGDMRIVTRDGRTINTNEPFRQTNRFVENEDGSIDLFGNDGKLIKTIKGSGQARTETIRAAENEAAAAQTAAADQSIRTGQARVAEIGEVKNKVNSLLGDVGITTTGPLGAVLQFVPGFDARNFAGLAKEVTSFLSLDKIAEMKEQSATGATGLGAVNEREFDALSTARVNLEQAQSPSAVKQALRRLLAILNRIDQTAQADISRARELQGEGSGESFEGFSIKRD